jgi:hypothetical protein
MQHAEDIECHALSPVGDLQLGTLINKRGSMILSRLRGGSNDANTMEASVNNMMDVDGNDNKLNYMREENELLNAIHGGAASAMELQLGPLLDNKGGH